MESILKLLFCGLLIALLAVLVMVVFGGWFIWKWPIFDNILFDVFSVIIAAFLIVCLWFIIFVVD